MHHFRIFCVCVFSLSLSIYLSIYIYIYMLSPSARRSKHEPNLEILDFYLFFQKIQRYGNPEVGSGNHFEDFLGLVWCPSLRESLIQESYVRPWWAIGHKCMTYTILYVHDVQDILRSKQSDPNPKANPLIRKNTGLIQRDLRQNESFTFLLRIIC